MSLTNGIVSSMTYDKSDEFNLKKFIPPFYGDVSGSPSQGVYILLLIQFARVCSYASDFNNGNKL